MPLSKLLNPITSLLSYALFTGSKLPNASNTNPSHLLSKSSQPPNLHICTTSSLFNLLAARALHLSLLSQSLDHQHHPHDQSFRYASSRLWDQFPSSLRQPHFSPSVSGLPVHAPTTSSYSVNSPLLPSITPSLFHSWLKTYLFHKSFPP